MKSPGLAEEFSEQRKARSLPSQYLGAGSPHFPHK